jgi:hypothetical protein
VSANIATPQAVATAPLIEATHEQSFASRVAYGISRLNPQRLLQQQSQEQEQDIENIATIVPVADVLPADTNYNNSSTISGAGIARNVYVRARPPLRSTMFGITYTSNWPF